MKALVTGASSGMGKDMALYLSNLGYDLYLVSRDYEKIEVLFKNVKTKVTNICLDLSDKDNCYKLYEMLKDENIDILVNNAGFGDAGRFTETSLDKELNMIDVNVRAYHILTKLFLCDFVKKKSWSHIKCGFDGWFYAWSLYGDLLCYEKLCFKFNFSYL